MVNMPNIEYVGDVSKFILAEDDPYDSILFNKDKEYFLDITNYSKFIKKCEQAVRNSDDYKGFISWIKNTLGINYCQISSNVHDTDTDIEMHHGPIFTLFDICEVIVNDFLKKGYDVTTFTIADKVLDEHFDLNVQVIMLSITNHEAVHNRDIFINYNQCIGNIDNFIKKYTSSLTDEQKYKIWNYFNLCENNPAFAKSFDKGLLDLDYVKKYIKI